MNPAGLFWFALGLLIGSTIGALEACLERRRASRRER